MSSAGWTGTAGGTARCPVDPGWTGVRRYLDGSLVLDSTFEVHGGAVRPLDALVIPAKASASRPTTCCGSSKGSGAP
jgi:hypothetical protein